MDFRDLSYVVAIAKYQNISKAADSLYISQPTLSKFLINHERELGHKLFIRKGHKYEPTMEGEIYLKRAEQILQIKDNLYRELDDCSSHKTREIHIGLPTMRSSYILPKILPAFHAAYPLDMLQIHENNTQVNEKLMNQGELELFFTTRPKEENPNYIYVPLWSEKLVIITPKGHAFSRFAIPSEQSQYPLLDSQLLATERFLQLTPQQITRKLTDTFLAQQNVTLTNTVTTGNLSALFELVSTGFGVSLVLDTPKLHQAETLLLDFYEPLNNISQEYVAVYRKDTYLSRPIKDLISLFRKLHQENDI